jgi:hypothetical protein
LVGVVPGVVVDVGSDAAGADVVVSDAGDVAAVVGVVRVGNVGAGTIDTCVPSAVRCQPRCPHATNRSEHAPSSNHRRNVTVGEVRDWVRVPKEQGGWFC